MRCRTFARDAALEGPVFARAVTDAVGSVDGDGRTLDIRLVAWGEVAQTPQGPETFVRGAFANVDPSRVMLESGARGSPIGNGREHTGAIIVGAATAIEEREDGAYGTFRVARTAAGDELLELVRPPDGAAPILRDASVVFRPRPGGSRKRADGVIERTDADLFRVGVVERGAYRSAQVVAARSAGVEDPMLCQTCNTEHAADAACPTAARGATGETIPPIVMARVANIEAAVARVEATQARMEAAAAVPQGASDGPLASYDSLGAFARAAYDDRSALRAIGHGSGDMLARTIADQITTNNEGLIQPGWLTDVKRIVSLGRRAITAMGGPGDLPSSGMTVRWPFLASSNTVVGTQATQKTEITSARVDIDDGEASIITYAGGSDISYQLLERSSPSYYDAYQRIILSEWGKVTDAAFAAALEAASGTTTQVPRGILGSDIALANPSAASDDIIDTTPDHGLVAGDAVVFTALTGGTGLTAGRVYWVVPTSLGAKTFRVAERPGGSAVGFSTDITAGNVAKVTDTGTKFRVSLFDASVSIEDATGQPASVVLASTDIFLMLAGMSGFVNPTPAGNPSNADGTAQASTLVMESSGLNIVRTPGVSAGKYVVSNPLAARFLEDGPKWATAEDVHLLGRDVAVYSYGATAVYVPAGIVEVTLV